MQEFVPKKITLSNRFTENAEEIIDFQNSLINNAIEKISKRKDDLILNKLKELGIEFDFQQEKDRRFKRFRIEQRENETSYYYNDGSTEGLRVITFVDTQTPFDKEDFSIGIETTYY